MRRGAKWVVALVVIILLLGMMFCIRVPETFGRKDIERYVREKINDRIMPRFSAVGKALDAYRNDSGFFPITMSREDLLSEKRPSVEEELRIVKEDAGPEGMGLRSRNQDRRELHALPVCLTTPIPYMSVDVLRSSFYNPKYGIQHSYSYLSDGQTWILVSPGQDLWTEIDPVIAYRGGFTEDSQYLRALTYDPTNGIDSGGDLWVSDKKRTMIIQWPR